ncbi:MAG: hypothetical protein J0M16_01425 [Gammaproteobacteria bacterium]|nr:hypothetical protein [Gammaproteobacteria bacterium]
MLLRLIKFPLALASLVAIASCANQNSTSAPTQSATFAHALSVCRFQHTGATNQKLALKATEEHVAECLARRGWSPSGERVDPDGDMGP